MKKQPPSKPARSATAKPAAAKSKQEATPSLLNRLESFLERNEKVIFYTTLLLSLVFSVLLFDVKMSEGNDDSDYIEGAYKFSNDYKSYYNSKAPLYPMVLSVPVSFFGINVPLLKSLSIIFMLLQITFIYLAFRKIIPYTVLFVSIIFISVNSYFLYFASQTYTEAFFGMLQAAFLLAARPLILNDSKKIDYKRWILFGFFLFLLTITKNISIGALGAVLLFFIFSLNWKNILLAFGSFLVFRIPFELIKKSIWGNENQFSSQYQILIQKDPYDASKGVDDLSGFIGRLFDNTSLYISKRLYQIMGFISPDSTLVNKGLVLITFIFIGIGLFHIIRQKNKMLLFVFLYTLCMAGLTFFVLQTRWDQPRMVLVYIPFMLAIAFFGLYSMFKSLPALKSITFIFFAALILGSSLISTITKAAKNFSVIKKNLAGDVYYGYTPDWRNFLELSKYAADSLPANSYVASRKAPMSFIYGGGKSFYPVYSVYSSDADSVLNYFKKEKVTHVLLASIRRNPKKIDGYIINTLHRMMAPVAQKYPDKVVLVKQMGESEPAYLYEIKY